MTLSFIFVFLLFFFTFYLLIYQINHIHQTVQTTNGQFLCRLNSSSCASFFKRVEFLKCTYGDTHLKGIRSPAVCVHCEFISTSFGMDNRKMKANDEKNDVHLGRDCYMNSHIERFGQFAFVSNAVESYCTDNEHGQMI